MKLVITYLLGNLTGALLTWRYYKAKCDAITRDRDGLRRTSRILRDQLDAYEKANMNL